MITLWRGDFGSGKTGGMTWQLNGEKLRGNRVIANYGIKCRDGDIESKVLASMPEDLKNVAMGLDEIHVFLDSRSGMKGKQRKITYFILQTRKRTVNLHCTTQALNQVDLRLRNHVDVIIDCRTLGCKDRKKCGMKDCHGPGKPDPFCGWYEYRVYDKHGTFKGTFHLFGPRDFDHLYDTEEVIQDMD